jgi:hypothetical protein
MASIHPISLLCRTDCEIRTLYHSFYLFNINQDDTIDLHCKLPQNRSRMDDIESGLKLFCQQSSALKSTIEKGSTVLTTSDGSRFYADWIAYSGKKFVAVSLVDHLYIIFIHIPIILFIVIDWINFFLF